MSSVPKSARRNAFILESEIGGLKEEPHEEQSVETMALEKQSNHNSLSNDIINGKYIINLQGICDDHQYMHARTVKPKL